MSEYKNVGQRLRQLRESFGVTRSQLESRSGVSRSYIFYVEKGRHLPSLRTLEKLSGSLGVGLKRFFVGSDDEMVLENALVQRISPLVRRLSREQQEHILKVLRSISMVQPHEDSANDSGRNCEGKKPPGLGQSYEPHNKQPNDDDQSNRMAGQ